MNAPTSDDWKELYDTAAQFKEAAPWTWLADDNLFAIQNGPDDETGYCSVMGNGGMEFGLAVFLGNQGLDAFRRLAEGDLDSERWETIEYIRSISVTFVDRRFLLPQDLEIIRSLGLRFRGRNNWPLFRSFLPGYAPWHLQREEAVFLGRALRFACEVATSVAGGLDLAERLESGQVYTLRGETAAPTRAWEGLPPPLPAKPAPTPDLPRLRKLKQSLRSPRIALAVDWFLLPTLIADDTERPYFPLAFLALAESGFIVGTEILTPQAGDNERQDALVRALEKAAMLPQLIVVPNEECRRLAQGVAEGLGCPLTVAVVPEMEAAKQELVGALGA